MLNKTLKSTTNKTPVFNNKFLFRSKFIVMKNEELKKAAIIRAEGEAEAAHLIADAVGKSGPGKTLFGKNKNRSYCNKKDRSSTRNY